MALTAEQEHRIFLWGMVLFFAFLMIAGAASGLKNKTVEKMNENCTITGSTVRAFGHVNHVYFCPQRETEK